MLHRVLHTPLRISAALLAALLLGLLLAACGGEDEDDNGPDLPRNNFGDSALDFDDHAPDFELPTPDGEMVALNDYLSAEQPVLLFFHMAGG